MPISASMLRKQLVLSKPLLNTLSLTSIRKGQALLGDLMSNKFRTQITVKQHCFDTFTGAWLLPRDERRQGVLLYLHGGGYVCGDLHYAIGAGSILCAQTGTRVFCAAYRLAPEHPFPAALDDAVEAYRYLLEKGYNPDRITLCGESAGGGLCYVLCEKLKALSMPLPCGIIAISPWTDHTASGESYEKNRDNDPNMTAELLRYYSESYTTDKTDPFVSPLFADVKGMPPSLIFVGGDEIMLDDATQMHQKLLEAGCKSQLIVRPERWHAYLLYGLQEGRRDLAMLDTFLNDVMVREEKLRWMPLDNAAKIYPAARREHWSNVFRLSATLKEDVDVTVLQSALDITVRRFPSIAVRLRRGMFWYYLQQLSKAPNVREEYSYPLCHMSHNETRTCAFRVIVYNKRIAVEFFHSLTDGNGGLIFLKSLVAEYLQQKYGVHIPAEKGVLGRLEPPTDDELEDCFLKIAGPVSESRKERTAWHLTGTPEPSEHIHLTCLRVSSAQLVETAHRYGVSVTAFLCAAFMMALQNMQQEQVPQQKKRKPIRVLIPVNLRTLYPQYAKTLRNFVLYTTPEILPSLGHYRFEEICQAVKHRLGLDVSAKIMSTKVTTNVNSETTPFVRLMPLFIKNAVMKAVFDTVGERKSCLTLSNLGVAHIPDAMIPYVERIDFVLGVQATAPYNCGVISYQDYTNINFIRTIQEPALERALYAVLHEMGLEIEVESNSNKEV